MRSHRSQDLTHDVLVARRFLWWENESPSTQAMVMYPMPYILRDMNLHSRPPLRYTVVLSNIYPPESP